MIIAIDGPAGSGKSTIAKKLAEDLHSMFLNSGSFYRALTLLLLQHSYDFSAGYDEDSIMTLASAASFDYCAGHLILDGVDVEHLLRSDAIEAHAARVSALVAIRHLINERVRSVASHNDIVCEGRDMTSVVFPYAEYKFYLDASVSARAKRRFLQGSSTLSLEEIESAIQQRDEIDKNKVEGSLIIAKDAYYLDTSDLTINEVCEIIKGKIQYKG